MDQRLGTSPGLSRDYKWDVRMAACLRWPQRRIYTTHALYTLWLCVVFFWFVCLCSSSISASCQIPTLRHSCRVIAAGVPSWLLTSFWSQCWGNMELYLQNDRTYLHVIFHHKGSFTVKLASGISSDVTLIGIWRHWRAKGFKPRSQLPNYFTVYFSLVRFPVTHKPFYTIIKANVTSI
jgi:hypothetical protein